MQAPGMGSWPSPDFLKILLESCGGGEKAERKKVEESYETLRIQS